MHTFNGTQKEALDRLHGIDPSSYARTRNYIGGSTGLSPYITRGALTLPQIKEVILQKYTTNEAYKLVFELAWREYWQREWLARGDSIFTDIKRDQQDVESALVPVAVIGLNTGIHAIDASLNGLIETGFMDNHARMWLAGIVCNTAHTHWWQPAKFMYYHLLDGDPASNSLSWQWVAGTFSSKKYLAAQANINKYSPHNQTGTYLDKTYAELSTASTPAALKERSELKLVWQQPPSDEVTLDPEKPTLLYHSFWLNNDWYKNGDFNRILVLEPSWFTRFPVSRQVTEFIVSLAKEIDGLQVYVGELNELQLDEANTTSKYHPSTHHWTGTKEPMDLMFPNIPDKPYGSFMSYWKQVQKKYPKLR